jgi:hypothetical protein
LVGIILHRFFDPKKTYFLYQLNRSNRFDSSKGFGAAIDIGWALLSISMLN